MISQAASEPSEVCANVHSEGIISHSASEPSEVRANVRSKGAIGMRSEGMINQAASVIRQPLGLASPVPTCAPRVCSVSQPLGLASSVPTSTPRV